MQHSQARTEAKDDVIIVAGPEGALSLELEQVGEGIARAYLRSSPRNPRLSPESVMWLSAELQKRPYSRIIVQDSRKRVLQKSLVGAGWQVGPAVPSAVGTRCSMVTTYDLPLDEALVDMDGAKPDLSNTSGMQGIGIEVDGRKAWAFYTDEGDTARIISEAERRTGMFVAENSEDMLMVADCLVRFLASAKKSWAVFSMGMGRFVRQFHPMTMVRMTLENPRAYEHGAVPVSRSNKTAAIRLFSEYYDESLLQARLRLRRYRAESSSQVFLVEGGFVITKVEGDAGLIYDIYVTPAKQGEGLGGELMRCALASLAGRVSSVYLHTSYPRAKRLYEKFGFRTVYSQLGIRLDEVVLTRPRSDALQ